MEWDLEITGPAQRDLRKLPVKDQEHIQAALVTMRDDPFTGDIVRLKAQPTGWRRRVGAYRILYDIYFPERQIVVAAILRWTSNTY